MAKRGAKREQFANRYRGRLSFGADASAAVFESFNTGIAVSGNNPWKWVILWCDIGPANVEDVPLTVDGGKFKSKLMMGTHTSMVEDDDMQCIAHVAHCNDISASGAVYAEFPMAMNIHSPIPVVSSVLTIGMVAINTAIYNSLEYSYEIGYMATPTTPNEVTEFLAAFGSL